MTIPPTADVPGPSNLTYASSMVSGDYRTLGKRQDNPNAAEEQHEGVNPNLPLQRAGVKDEQYFGSTLPSL